MMTRSGTVSQGGLRHQEDDYADQQISHPVLGVIINVYTSDDPLNWGAGLTKEVRSTQLAARVLVLNDGSDSPWILPNVVIPPRGCSGYDNYYEEIPKGVTGTIDESKLTSRLTDVSADKWDGDWCVVDFIGGSIDQPFMVTWWPHPANRRDPLTSGAEGNLEQGRRLARRFQGTRFVVTEKGTVLIDTSEANHPLSKGKRKKKDEGGDIRVTLKESRELELNWNPSVFGDPDEKDFLWEPDPKKKQRKTTSTHVKVNKTLIEAVAGERVHLKAKDDGKGTIDASADHVNLGGPSAPEKLVWGNTFKSADDALSTALDTWVQAVQTVISADPVIPPPIIATFATACTAFKAAIQQYKGTNILSDVSKTR